MLIWFKKRDASSQGLGLFPDFIRLGIYLTPVLVSGARGPFIFEPYLLCAGHTFENS